MLTKTLIKAKWYDLFPRGHPGQPTFFIVEFRKRFLQLLAQLRETRNTQRVPKLSCLMLLQHVVYAILCLLPCSTFIRACAERMCVCVCLPVYVCSTLSLALPFVITQRGVFLQSGRGLATQVNSCGRHRIAKLIDDFDWLPSWQVPLPIPPLLSTWLPLSVAVLRSADD